jgi:hypothetical protein
MGSAPGALSGVREVYEKIPDAACAFQESGGDQLNLDCPRVHADLCQASAELVKAFTADRQPAKGREFQASAERQYGCAASGAQ